MDELKAVESVYMDGQWFAATWLQEILDPATMDGNGQGYGVRLAEIEARLATIERRIDGLEIGVPRRPGAYFIPGGRLIEIERRLGALEHDTTMERLAREDMGLRLENVARRARLRLPSGQMYEAYDADRDAAPVSYWDMRLLAMIEKINDRLAGVAEVGDDTQRDA